MKVRLSSIHRWVSQYKKEQTGVTPKASTVTLEKIRIQEFKNRLSP